MEISKNILYTIIVYSLISCTVERDVDFNKYKILILAKEVGDFYKINVDTSGNSENAIIEKWHDGEYDLTYDYDSPDKNKTYSPLSYTIDISKRNSVNQAKDEFEMVKYQFKNRNSNSEYYIKEFDSIIFSGDQNFYAFRYWKGKPNGILFTHRENDVVYTVITSGYFNNDHSFLKNLIEPKLKYINGFKILDK